MGRSWEELHKRRGRLVFSREPKWIRCLTLIMLWINVPQRRWRKTLSVCGQDLASRLILVVGRREDGHWIRAGIEASIQQSNSCAGRALALLGAPSASGLGGGQGEPVISLKVSCHFQSLPSSPARFGRWQSILQRCEGRRHSDFCKWRWAGPHPVGPSHVPSHRPVSQTCATYPSAKAKC